MSNSEKTQNPEEPQDTAIGNTEPAEPSELDGGGSEKAGDRAQAPEGLEREEYPGPSEETEDE